CPTAPTSSARLHPVGSILSGAVGRVSHHLAPRVDSSAQGATVALAAWVPLLTRVYALVGHTHQFDRASATVCGFAGPDVLAVRTVLAAPACDATSVAVGRVPGSVALADFGHGVGCQYFDTASPNFKLFS